jgi:predicted ribosomally synthesized peptide with SipW-like signal peptide
MAVAILLVGGGAGATLALFADTEQVAATSSTAASFSDTTYWLHNNPTPPSGNTNMQANLVMNTTAPTATTLFNYDADQDTAAGRLLLRGGGGAGETDLSQYQNWRGPTAGLFGQSINGTVTVEFWSAMRNFTSGTAGEVRVFLRDFDTAGLLSTEIANTTIAAADWQGGSTGWVKKTATFNVTAVLLVGHKLEVKLIVGAGAADDMWLAYDTTVYRSRVRLP